MSEKPQRATMAQAKAAWEAFPEKDRSYRKVVHALKAEGVQCAVSTLQRWKESGWSAAHIDDLGSAARKVSSKIHEHEGKAMTRLEVIEIEEALMKTRAGELELIVFDDELARQAMRKSLIAQIVLSEQIIRRAAVLVEVAPDIAAKIVDVLKGPAANTTIVVTPRTEKTENGDGAKVVEGRMITEQSPTAMAIESFKQRQRTGIAA